MRLAVVGLGRLGAPFAATLAAGGSIVSGVDRDEEVVRAIASGRSPVVEAGMEAMLGRAKGRLSATSDYREALSNTDVSFVVVPTPSGSERTFLLTHVLAAVREIGLAMRHQTGKRHVVVITSTVMPGSTAGPIRDALEETSAMTVGRDIGLCYSPEFIALGTVINDLTEPDMILLGESDTESGDVVLAALKTICASSTPVARMDATSAEIAKLAVNTFVTTKISYANMIGEICDRLPGANAAAVTAAVGMDSRIGPKYLRPGAPYGGPCFPRDNAALAALAISLGQRADIAEATDAINRRQVDRVVALAKSYSEPGGRLAVLGLSYKPGTPVQDESFGVHLAQRCAADGFSVVAWDPTCQEGCSSPELVGVPVTDSLTDCLAMADIAVIATPWPQLRHLPAVITDRLNGLVIIDCWRLLEGVALGASATLVHDSQGQLVISSVPPTC